MQFTNRQTVIITEPSPKEVEVKHGKRRLLSWLCDGDKSVRQSSPISGPEPGIGIVCL